MLRCPRIQNNFTEELQLLTCKNREAGESRRNSKGRGQSSAALSHSVIHGPFHQQIYKQTRSTTPGVERETQSMESSPTTGPVPHPGLSLALLLSPKGNVF